MTTPPARPTLDDLGREPFVSLTTFRRTGAPVSTPVWIARDGDALAVTTPSASGKVKRLRHTPRVELRPCSRTGTVKEGAPTSRGVAQIVSDAGTARRLTGLVRGKYPVEYRVMMLVERLVARGRRDRVVLRITVTD
ncbi:PPOX class F420-dependent oxidoreductase [Cellulomonas aerilata]|uniref:PPOX class F420-dependent oxidoreductase n=1 Tax=Cellulomonas aerilata TaxID=515326 RepID=A0A512D862_9CELL|nr:PPOX class F420-dependent oxidoreductase [Cellulomonas aerilata]GEO32607.1 PPOX class F420-dependent oxidoreductase [Cellulomonas aerilata]